MDYEALSRETSQTLIGYLTYQAVRAVADQLSEGSPPRGLWFRRFTSEVGLQDTEKYMGRLFAEDPVLANWVLETRARFADYLADRLPTMVRTGMQEANLHQQRQYIERWLQPETTDSSEPNPELPSE